MRDASAVLSDAEITEVIGSAVRAPSVYNTQPWLFRPLSDGVEVYADRSRQLSVADPTGRSLRVSCGAAIFNIRLALAHLGWDSEVTLLPERARPDLLARIQITEARPPTPEENELYAAIPRRHSNRAPFLDSTVPLDALAALRAAAKSEGAWLDLLISPAALAMAVQLVRAADNVLLRGDAYQAELAAWTRYDDNAVDGVTGTASGPAPEPQDLLARRDFGGAPRGPGREFESEPVVGVLGGTGDTPRDDLLAGQALQRVLLTATRVGLVASMLSQPIDVPQVREQLRIGLRRYGLPQMVLRIGHGEPAFRSGRRPIEDVLLVDPPAPAPAPALPTVPTRPGRSTLITGDARH